MALHRLPGVQRVSNPDPDLLWVLRSPPCPPSRHHVWRLLPPALAGALPGVCVPFLGPHFLPVFSSFTLRSCEAGLAPHRQTYGLLPFSAPCVVFTSLLEHMSPVALDGWVHLSLSSTAFTCLEVESAADSFPYRSATDALSDTE